MAGESKSRGRTGEADTASFGPRRERSLRVTRSVSIPRSEIELRFSRSSGPGGQHAQKTETRAEAVFDVESSSGLTDAQKRRVIAKTGPVIRAVAQDERSQWRNRELAIERVVEALREALRLERARAGVRAAPAGSSRQSRRRRPRLPAPAPASRVAGRPPAGTRRRARPSRARDTAPRSHGGSRTGRSRCSRRSRPRSRSQA